LNEDNFETAFKLYVFPSPCGGRVLLNWIYYDT